VSNLSIKKVSSFALGTFLILMFSAYVMSAVHTPSESKVGLESTCSLVWLGANNAMRARATELTLQEVLEAQLKGDFQINIWSQLNRVLTILAYGTEQPVSEFANGHQNNCLDGNSKELLPTKLFNKIVSSE